MGATLSHSPMSVQRDEQTDLYRAEPGTDLPHAPLAERMRPRDFSEFLGQEELIGPDRPLRRAIEADTVSSVILWGPPGSGKTTLAQLIAKRTSAAFVSFSAVTSGIAELRAVVKAAEQRRLFSGQRTILFVDEIHRFNKAQQDAFLPHVEKGTIVLLGATTENPSFEIIAPLLSRSLVVVLQALTDDALGQILDLALTDAGRGFGRLNMMMTPEARRRMIAFGNGDARAVLTALEHVVAHTSAQPDGTLVLDEGAVEAALSKKALRYDRAGEEHYNLISAYIKSLRDSDPDGALYWMARMLEGGEDPLFLARRMVVFASEDIGNAQPQALLIAVAVSQAVQFVGMPEARITLAHGTTYLATCSKDNASYAGITKAMDDVRTYGNLPVPFHLRNAVTPLMKKLGYGEGYRYVHDDPSAKQGQSHLPAELKGVRYYSPKKN